MDEYGVDDINDMKKTRDPFHEIKAASSSDHQNRHDLDHHQSVYDDSSSSDSGELQAPKRNLRLKLKIPAEQAEANKEGQQQSQPQPRPKHFCEICNKEFSSGKAFGGHVRIHSSDYKKKKKKRIGVVGNVKKIQKKRRDEKERDLIRADVEGKIRCCLCGKEFQTMHSLFGHMRRHPDRSWKGIRPPSNLLGRTAACSSSSSEKFKISSCSSVLEDDDDHNRDYDDNDDVMSSSMIMEEVTEDVQEAACCLMMLSWNASNYRPARKLGSKGETSSRTMRKPKLEVRKSVDKSTMSYNNKGKGKVFTEDEQNDNNQVVKPEKDKEMVVDMKIKMEIEVTMNPRDDHSEEAKGCDENNASKTLGFDLNQPYVDPNEEEGNGWFRI